MPITPEQMKIVESQADFLRVNAFAGTGKTTTLVAYAKARPMERMLYLAFNKSVQVEAAAKFPSNVKCVTSHGLAFPEYGSLYADAGKLTPKLRVNEVVGALQIPTQSEDFKLFVADAAIKTVDRFLASNLDAIDSSLARSLITPDSGVHEEEIADYANVLWRKMCDLNDSSVGMVHDGYLKLFQLKKPQMKFDTVLFDEAQDANPATSDLVEMQKNMRKVAVGDSHQQLYSFRGAMNAMKKFQATETLYLTKSFRFGQNVADVANMILSKYKHERRQIQGTDERAYIGNFSRSAPQTIIARSNATLFDEAVQSISMNKKINFIGGIAGYRIAEVYDTFNLWAGNTENVRSPYLKSFREFDRMDEYAGAVDDKELKSLIGLVKKYGHKLPKMVDHIKNGNVTDPTEANIFLTTAHKSKGLEWDNVRLADDYMKLSDGNGSPRKLEFNELEEANIVYVAATRAKKQLNPFPELHSMWKSEQAKEAANKMPEWARPAQVSALRMNKSK